MMNEIPINVTCLLNFTLLKNYIYVADDMNLQMIDCREHEKIKLTIMQTGKMKKAIEIGKLVIFQCTEAAAAMTLFRRNSMIPFSNLQSVCFGAPLSTFLQ